MEKTAEDRYSFEGQEHFNLQTRHEIKSVVPESTYGSIEAQPYHEDECSAVDLRTTRTRPPSMGYPSESNIEYYDYKKDAVSTAHLFKNVNPNDLYLVNVSSDSLENPPENVNCTSFEPYKDYFNQDPHHPYFASYQKIYPQKKYTFKQISSDGPSFLNTENNDDFLLVVDQETQTQIKEFKEASVQTEKDKCTYSLIQKKKLSNFGYSCLICQRFYSSKSSYDRHTLTHVKNGIVITNHNVTKKTKFMVFGETVCKSQPHIGLPSQEPKLSKLQCGICCKLISSRVDRDFHRNNLVLEKFPMIKCKHCHVKFFTLGAVQEHVKFVHEINTAKCNAYCCIFCNESFESSYSFQLHLDEHLYLHK